MTPGGVDSLVMSERLAIAALIGLAVGTEREWSGPASGPARRFAGLRTFLLVGMAGGIAGLLVDLGAVAPATALLAAAAAFSVVAYAMTVRREGSPLDGTTEAAALVVLGLGVLAGTGYLILSAGCAAIVVFALGEKQQLHRLVGRIGQREMHAALEFLVLALVVLPLLPTGPLEGFFGIRPQTLWGVVLLLSGINFAGYVARQAVGPGRGYGVTGALAGLISSTALTLQFSRLSRAEPQHVRGLALGVTAACTILPLRVLLVSIVLNSDVAREVLFYVVPAFLTGAAISLALARDSTSVESEAPDVRNPLRLASALQMAVVFELAIIVIGYARAVWGSSGLVGSSVVFGLTDLDALTVSMNRLPGAHAVAAMAARGIGIGILANTIVKLGIVLLVGQRQFKRLTAGGLSLTAIVLLAVLWWRW